MYHIAKPTLFEMTLFKRTSFLVFLLFLYQQACGAGVKQCYEYYCVNIGIVYNCDQEVTIEDCSTYGEGDYSCIFIYSPDPAFPDTPFQLRGCIDNNPENFRLCQEIDEKENATCFICQEDLCNINKTTIQETNTGVKECYSCKGSCEKMVVQKCPEEGDHVCLTSKLKYGPDFHEIKGCYLDNEEIVNTCKNIDKAEDGSCNLCREDLCNK